MAPVITNMLTVRDDGMAIDNPTMFYLLLVLTVLFGIGMLCVGALCVLKQIRRKREQRALPDCEKATPKSHRRGRHPPSISFSEKAAFLESDSGPPSPVPEIRVTFPEEVGPGNKRQSRVVVVRISEQGSVGYEPYEEQLPAYQKEQGGRFQSLDLERLGGLKEIERS